MRPRPAPTGLQLWALCDHRAERIGLGRASQGAREGLMARVLLNFMFWGGWRNTRIRVVTDSEPTLEAFGDITDDAVQAYGIKYPNDPDLARILKRSAGPEIVIDHVEVVEGWR